MKDWALLLGAIAAFLWPVFAFVALFSFKNEIRGLLSRLRKGKLFGQEIELGESLNQLDASAIEAVAEVAALPEPVGAPSNDSSSPLDGEKERQLLMEATRSPKAALMLLAADLEREVRHLLASLGLLDGRRVGTLPQALKLLDQRGKSLHQVTSALNSFWNVRSRIVHGHEASEDDILRAIDSGLMIFRAIREIPHEVNIVYHPEADVFSDSAGLVRREDVHAVILETTSPDGTSTSMRVFPSTRRHFKKGQRVSLEWLPGHVYAQSWYRDPDTQEIKYGWTASAEFVGRSLEEV
jgi:hypothetical protein